MRLAEGSEVKVTCANCGRYQWVVTIMEGRQRLQCPECGYSTQVDFIRDRDGGFKMNTNQW